MKPVSFRFDPEKLVHVLAYFAGRGLTDLTKLKAAKLVYYLDKHHLWKFGRPIVGGPYWCMPYGPVPGNALQAMNDMIDATEVESELAEDQKRLIDEYLEVKADGAHPRFEAKRQFDPEVFSKSELAALESVFEKFGTKTANQLVSLTHKDPTWTVPNQSRLGGRASIPYHMFFEDADPQVRQIWELIEAEQMDRDCDDEFDPSTVATVATVQSAD